MIFCELGCFYSKPEGFYENTPIEDWWSSMYVWDVDPCPGHCPGCVRRPPGVQNWLKELCPKHDTERWRRSFAYAMDH